MLYSSLASAISPLTVLKFGGGLVQHKAIELTRMHEDVPMTIAAPLRRGTRVTS